MNKEKRGKEGDLNLSLRPMLSRVELKASKQDLKRMILNMSGQQWK